jgi:hypothetical protein
MLSPPVSLSPLHALLSVLFACRPLVIYHPAGIHPPSFAPSQAENTLLSKREGVPDPLRSRLRTAISKDPASKLLYIHTPAINPPVFTRTFLSLYHSYTSFSPWYLCPPLFSLFLSLSLWSCTINQPTPQPKKRLQPTKLRILDPAERLVLTYSYAHIIHHSISHLVVLYSFSSRSFANPPHSLSSVLSFFSFRHDYIQADTYATI